MPAIDPAALFTDLLSQAPVAVITALIMYAGWRLRNISANAELQWFRDNFHRASSQKE